MPTGRYIPNNTPLHHLDPRVKILCVTCLITAVFGSRFFFVALPMLPILLGLGRLAQIPFRVLWNSLWPVLPFLAITSLLNAFLTPGQAIIIFSVKIEAITIEGLYRALQISTRLCAVVLVVALLTLTTSPLELSDGLQALFRPLGYLHFPVSEFALALTIALRFVPTLFDEADRLHKAQIARGADFSGNGLGGIAKWFPLLVPLFVSAFSRADRLAISLELRGYQGNIVRTHFRPLSLTQYDALVFLGVLFLMLCVL
jgi:energy-coupling factor transport system permease protein